MPHAHAVWSLCAVRLDVARRKVLLLAGFVVAAESIPTCTSDDGVEPVVVGPLSARQRRLVAQFEVPRRSIASDAFPTHLEAEIVAWNADTPCVIEAFVLVTKERAPGPRDSVVDSRSFRRLPFGRMDVVAPFTPGAIVSLFPYEAAEAVRLALVPGDTVLVGIEAMPFVDVVTDKPPPSADIKVRRVVNW
jgi:hypothetical protein